MDSNDPRREGERAGKVGPVHGRLSALFLRWRHTGDRHYDGFICTITLDQTGTWCLTELWVDSAMLEPA